MDLIKVFGTNVKKYRLERGYSQEDLADKCGLHRTYIGSIECLHRNVSLKSIQKIAKALEVEPNKLLACGEENK